MPKQKKDHLVQLIRSLSAAEKRSFRLFSNRNGQNDQALFMQLFDYIDKTKRYDEAQLTSKIPQLKKSQISNLKAHLYQQILLSLRQSHRNKLTGVRLRELLDFSKILYARGLYNPSLEMLDKAKKLADVSKDQSLKYTALSFEKHIESMYITGSMYPKAKALVDETNELIDDLKRTNEISNFALLLYSLYLRFGYVKNKEQFEKVKNYFIEFKPQYEEEDLKFYDKLYWIQSHVWYSIITQDFPNYYKHTFKWIQHFDSNEEMKSQEASLYLKGIHNLLNALFVMDKPDRFKEAFLRLDDFSVKSQGLSINENSNFKYYSMVNQLNMTMLSAKYECGLAFAKSLENLIDNNAFNWDINRKKSIWYKIACIYFGCNELEYTITALNKITDSEIPKFKSDIQCFARILNLIAHFDLGNELLVSYQIKSVYRYLLKVEDLQKVQNEIFIFLRKTTRISPDMLRSEFELLRDRLIILREDPYERRPFLYLDIISWLEAKLEGTTILKIIQRKKLNS